MNWWERLKNIKGKKLIVSDHMLHKVLDKIKKQVRNQEFFRAVEFSSN